MVIDSDHQECTAQSAAIHRGAAPQSRTAAATVVSVADDVIKWARVTGDVTVPRADLVRDPGSGGTKVTFRWAYPSPAACWACSRHAKWGRQ